MFRVVSCVFDGIELFPVKGGTVSVVFMCFSWYRVV